ncbi:MAG TPA: GNAT family N-acetyltransferase, partial [bacterium]|nr:GNAT family N-acetyltransferase [bacterium]
ALGGIYNPSPMAITYRELTPDLWPQFETLFGDKGACGGCWCMYWRVEKGGKTWDAMTGDPAKAAMRQLVTAGEATGILAFDGDTPVGWCSFAPRTDYPRLERTKAYARDDLDGVWSIPCFFIVRTHRGRGVARGLLTAAVKAIRKRKGRAIEAYPVTLTADGKKLPAAFAYTGPLPIFEEQGFEVIQRLAPSRPLVRLDLRRK